MPEEVEQFAAQVATGSGTSTGTTSLAVTNVTGQIIIGATLTGAGVPANTTIVSQKTGPTGGAGTYVTSGNTTLTNIPITFTPPPTASFFPDFKPIVPPPTIGQGGGAPPAFPPPTPPPIGAIPPGVLVGPAIAAAGVPPSNAGYVQPRFGTGSASLPLATSWFPSFSTAPYTGFPNQPPAGVPIVFSNIYTGGVTQTTPPHTNTAAVLPLGTNWGPPIGPALPHIASEMFAEAEKYEGTVYERQAAEAEEARERQETEDEEPPPRRPPQRRASRQHHR